MDDTRQANVVLTADTQQYQQQVTSSAAATNTLADSVDKLSKKLSDLSKSAGRKLVVVSAADVAALTAATAAYASFEHQMSSLNAQAAVLSKTVSAQHQIFSGYTGAVQNLRKEFPVTTQAAADLVMTLSKFNINGGREIQKLSETFAKAQGATGESASAMASSMLQLQRSMGTSTKDTQKYTDQVITLAAKTNTSASALTDFAATLAPIAKVAGATQTEITGVSAAFARAGQDGYAASNAYTQILSRVTNAIQTGSPDLAQYANLIGTTVGQFKDLGANEGVLRIFDTLQSQGKGAIDTLNQLGFEGVRTQRSLSALASGGGLRGSIAESRAAYGDNSTNRGAQAGYEGITNALTKLSTQFKEFGEIVGANFGPAIEAFIKGMTKGMEIVNAFMAGPAGKLLSWAAAIAAPIAAIGGGLLIAAGALAKVASVGLIGRSAAVTGLRDALRGNVYQREAEGLGGTFNVLPGARPLVGRTGERVAGGAGGMISRYGYMAGNFLGSTRWGEGPGQFESPEMRAAAREGRVPFWQRAAAVPPRGMAAGLNLISDSYAGGTRAGWDDATKRPSFFGKQRISDYALFSAFAGGGGSADDPAGRFRPPASQETTQLFKRATEGLTGLGKSANLVSKEAGPLARSFGALSGATGRFMATLGSVAMTTGRMGVAAGGAAAGALGINPWIAGGLAAAGGAYFAYDKFIKDQDQSRYVYNAQNQDLLGSYASAVGQTMATPQQFLKQQATAPTGATSLTSATNITPTQQAYFQSSGYEYTDDKIKNFGKYDDYKRLVVAQLSSGGAGLDPKALQGMVSDVGAKFGAGAATDFANSVQSAVAGGKVQLDTAGFIGTLTTGTHAQIGNASSRYGEAINTLVDAASINGLTARSDTSVAALNQAFTAGSKPGTSGYSPLVNEDALKGFLDAIQKQVPGADLSKINVNTRTGSTGRFIEQWTPKDWWGLVLENMSPDARKQFMADHADILAGAKTTDEMASALAGSGMQLKGGDLFAASQSSLRQKYGDVGAGYNPRTTLAPAGSSAVVQAYVTENPNDQYRAMQALVQGFTSSRGIPASLSALQEIQSQQGSSQDKLYQQAQGAQQIILARRGFQQQFLGRPEQFAQQIGDIQAQRQNLGGDENEMQKRNQLLSQQRDLVSQQYQYYKSLALTIREFNVQQERGAQDFQLSRSRMDEDYQLSRSRAEEDFNRQRNQAEFDYALNRKRSEFDFRLGQDRAQQNFDRSTRRGSSDFYLSRTRQEKDFQHQVQVMSEQTAKSSMDIYQRVTVQRTQDAGVLMTNARDQLQVFRKQAQNLEKLREMGVSDATIQQLGLTDPANAQQLERFVSDLTNRPKMVGQFNRVSAQRVKAAGKVATDESSMDWQEMARQYNLSRERGLADFQRAQKRSQVDFNRSMMQAQDDYQRSLARQQDDFQRMMERQNEQFDISMTRGEEDYHKTVDRMVDDYAKQMNRAQEDLNRMATDIHGSFQKIVRTSIGELRGQAREMAQDVLKTFNGLRHPMASTADDIARILTNKWGVTFQGSHGSPQHITNPRNRAGEMSGSGGGSAPRTMPTVHREEKKSTTGDGVVFFPLPSGSYSTGTPFGQKGDAWASGYHTGQDFPAPMGTPIAAVMGGEVSFAGWGGEDAYGNFTKLYHGKDPQGRTVETWYAHQSAQRVKAGEGVDGGEHIGNVGYSGNVIPKSPAGSHLHLEYRLDGQAMDPMILLGKSGVHLTTGGGGGAFDPQEFLHRRWPKLEKAAAGISFMGGYAPGDWSEHINKVALDKLRTMADRRGFTNITDMLNGSAAPPGGTLAPNAPDNVAGNKRIARAMAAARGWTGREWDSLYALWMRESGFQTHADNPTSSAYGIPQALPGSKMASAGADWHDNPRTQIEWGLGYIKGRYGDPAAAWAHSQATGWYGEGGVFNSPNMIGVAERGPEVVLPLDHRGAEFVATILSRISTGQDARGMNTRGSVPMGCTHQTIHQSVDKSNKFTGPIHVTADSPNQFLRDLREQRRHGALSAPSLSGTR